MVREFITDYTTLIPLVIHLHVLSSPKSAVPAKSFSQGNYLCQEIRANRLRNVSLFSYAQILELGSARKQYPSPRFAKPLLLQPVSTPFIKPAGSSPVAYRESGTKRKIYTDCRKLASRTGLKGIRLHDARHIHASFLLKQGVHPKVVQERLGHTTISTKLDTYSHVAPGLQQAAADKFDSVLQLKESKLDRELKEIVQN